MPRYVRVSFTEADVTVVARMLDDYAPRTCDVVWDSLPVEGDVYHSRYSGSDFYILPPALDPDLGSENATRTPIAGDLTYAHVPPGTAGIPPEMAEAHPEGLADMCVWYQRDNYHPGEGLNVYARAVEGMADFADTCGRLFREGYAHETLRFERAEDFTEDDPKPLLQQRRYL